MYLILKSLHIIFVVAWFAGLFYIFRLFVYHVQKRSDPSVVSVFQVMENKLLKIIIIPGSILTLLSGGLLISTNPTMLLQSWLQWKIGLVIVLLGYQLLAWKTYVHFKNENYYLSEKSCRFINEVPTIILFLVVFLVILKP